LSDWDDFQAHRKVYGVIGVLHADQTNRSWKEAEAELNHYSKSYPDVVLKRLFVLGFKSDAERFAINDVKLMLVYLIFYPFYPIDSQQELASLVGQSICVTFFPEHSVDGISSTQLHAATTLESMATAFISHFLNRVQSIIRK